MKSTIRPHRLAAAAVLAVLGLSAQAQTVKIAIAGAMTGSVAQYGDMMKAGALTAIEQVNAAGGVNGKKLEPVIMDDACEPKQAVAVANKIVSQGIKYVINTLSHADHTYGSYLFPQAELISHELARQMLATYGVRGLEQAKEHTPELRQVHIRLPKIVFNEGMVIRLGGKTIHLIHTPGPSPECCAEPRVDHVPD